MIWSAPLERRELACSLARAESSNGDWPPTKRVDADVFAATFLAPAANGSL